MRRVMVLATALALGGCQRRDTPRMVVVYNPAMQVSLEAPHGWTTAAGVESGFAMQSFSPPADGEPELRVQTLAGPMPAAGNLDSLAEPYLAGQTIAAQEAIVFHGASGKAWHLSAADGSEASYLFLAAVDDRLYGLYAEGRSEAVRAHAATIEAMWASLRLEQASFFELYEREDFGLRLRRPVSWKPTQSIAHSARGGFFVAFRSPPLAVAEGGATVHATLEVTVGRAEPGLTLEGFYAERVKMLGDNYRLVRHERIREGRGIADLYATETQLASYLERTYYFVEDSRSYIFKFNVQNSVYRHLEPWMQAMAETFEPYAVPPVS
jgi:hypothetical protein